MAKISSKSARVIEEIKKRCKAENKKIVFVSGLFNIVHPGHLRLLRYASECGDFLVVGVLGAEHAGGAFLDEKARLDGVAAISWVNHALLLGEPPEDFISHLKPDIVVKGKEFEGGQKNNEQSAVSSYGGKLVFCSGDSTFSSVDLLKREMALSSHPNLESPIDYIKRHKIDLLNLERQTRLFANCSVLVFGDLIVDEFVQCDPIGMSQEDPTIVVTPIISEKFIGGAGIVAAHAGAWGCKRVQIFSVVGDDDLAIFAKSKLFNYGLEPNLFIDETRPTTLKQRFRAADKTLLRVSHLRQHKISQELQDDIFSKIISVLDDINLLILSDFNYGCLPQKLVDEIISECRSRNILVAADSQSSSQVGDISRFKNVNLITPTEREARLALNNFDDGLVVIAKQLQKKAEVENIIITLGKEGLLALSVDPRASLESDLTDRLPALNPSPRDPSGAGDCLLACTALARTVGLSIWESIFLGSVAAACQVSRVGNTPIALDEILTELALLNDKLLEDK